MENTHNVAYTLAHDGTLTLLLDGKLKTVGNDHAKYREILDDLKQERYEGILEKLDLAAALDNFVSPSGKLRVTNGVVTYRGRIIQFEFVDRLLQMLDEDLPVLPFVRFIERSMLNPSRSCIQELYRFISSPDKRTPLPIMPDGRFLGYKTVRPDWMDWHTNTVKYVPLHLKYADNPQVTDEGWLLQQQGKLIGRPRWDVDDTLRRECSTGYHVGTFEYLQSFHRNEERNLLALACDPSQVVAADGDSGQHKIRLHVVECRQQITEEFVAIATGETPPTPHLPLNPEIYDEDLLGYMSDSEDYDSYEVPPHDVS